MIPGRSCSWRKHEIDGAVLQSQPDSVYTECKIRFEADDSGMFNRKKLQLKVDRWDVTSCDVEMAIYEGSSDMPFKVFLY